MVLSTLFGYDTKNTENKSKDKQMEIYQTKKLLHSKENNQQSEETKYITRENIRKPR